MSIKAIVAVGVVLAFFVTGCANQAVDNCDPRAILLDESHFPAGSTALSPFSPVPEGTSRSVGATVYMEKGIFNQLVFPYSTSGRAKAEFKEELRDPMYSEWLVPESARNLKLTADDYRIVCGSLHGTPMCVAILLHAHYYVFLSAHIHEDELTNEGFVPSVAAVDQRLESCLP